VVTAVAVLCSTAKTCPEIFWPLCNLAMAAIALVAAVVIAVEIFSWIRRPTVDGDMRGGKCKALLRSRHFWIGFWLAVPVVICLNVIPYCLTYGTNNTDGFEVARWPLDFWVCGGYAPIVHFDCLYLLIDILVAVVLAAAIGVSLRDGAGPFLARARALLRKMRSWPREDDS
jgi:hypothetical protein